MNLLPIALALMTAFSWAFSQVLGKIVVRDMNSTTFNTVRISIAAVMFTPLVLINGLRIAGTWAIVAALMDGIFGMAVGLLIYYYCMQRAPAHKVITIGNASPVWTLILALLLLGESMTVLLPFSLALVLVGSFLLVPRKKEPGSWGPAVPLAMLVAVLWGLDLVLRKLAINLGTDIMSFIWLSMVTAALVLISTSLATRSWRGQHFTRRNVSLIIVSGIFAHIFGTLVFMLALEMESVVSLLPFNSAIIPFGFLMSILLVRERPNLKSIIGMATVFFGVVLAAI